jgi:hypothetical protein
MVSTSPLLEVPVSVLSLAADTVMRFFSRVQNRILQLAKTASCDFFSNTSCCCHSIIYTDEKALLYELKKTVTSRGKDYLAQIGVFISL